MSKTETSGGLSPTVGVFILVGLLVCLLGLLAGTLFSFVDLSVAETQPAAEYSGDATQFETLDSPEYRMIGQLIDNTDSKYSTLAIRELEGAYEKDGTVYIIERSEPYLKFG